MCPMWVASSSVYCCAVAFLISCCLAATSRGKALEATNLSAYNRVNAFHADATHLAGTY